MKHSLPASVPFKNLPTMLRRFLLLGCTVFLAGCIHVKLDPVKVHATVDVNVKVDRALDEFFGDIDKKSTTVVRPPANQP
jgi:hypothetical protein